MELSELGQQRRTEAVAFTDDDSAEHPEKRWLRRLQRRLGINEGVEIDAIHDTGISHGRAVLTYEDEVDVAVQRRVAACPRPVEDRRMAAMCVHEGQGDALNLSVLHGLSL